MTNTPFKPDKEKTVKHLFIARTLLLGNRDTWMIVGHLTEAETYIAGLSCEIMERIREARHSLEKQNIKPNLDPIINTLNDF